jgi:hypothetical protein
LATGGVPFLVKELVRTIAEEDIEPTAAASSRIAALAPRTVSQSIALRLRRLSTVPRELAHAAAVLGEADLRLAAGLAGVTPGIAAAAADELADAGILEEGRPLRFVHPIVRAAIEADLTPGERAALHRAAAWRLEHEGASADRVAAHLLASDPAGKAWPVESLRAAARAAVANGAPNSAAAYLRRALAEPPAERLRPDVLLELGFAESYVGDPRLRLTWRPHSPRQATPPPRSRSRSRSGACSRSRGATARRWRRSTAPMRVLAAPIGRPR